MPHSLQTRIATPQTASRGAPTSAGAAAVSTAKVTATASTATRPVKKLRNGRSSTLCAVDVNAGSKPATSTSVTSSQASSRARFSSATAGDSAAWPRTGPSARTSSEDGARGYATVRPSTAAPDSASTRPPSTKTSPKSRASGPSSTSPPSTITSPWTTPSMRASPFRTTASERASPRSSRSLPMATTWSRATASGATTTAGAPDPAEDSGAAQLSDAAANAHTTRPWAAGLRRCFSTGRRPS